MKKTLLIFAILLMLGTSVVVLAQTAAGERQGIVYYTPQQNARHFTIWVDDIEFGPQRTTVTMHYLRASGSANLIPSTKLICHLKGGKTKALDLQSAYDISTRKDQYTPLGRGYVFKAYFPALAPADVARLKSVDFMEDPSGLAGGNVFNITDIKISKKHQVIQK